MAALHEALASLAPTDWNEVPKDNLKPYVEELLTAAELVCSTVPPPPNGTPFAESAPATTDPNTARSHKDMQPSKARPLPPQEEFEELQSQWGKPMKFSAKENPLEVAVFKMAGKDRHGGWFARRSVHEGIGFSKFKDAMSREFDESLKVEGGPGAGCIRGIGADKRLEDLEVDGVGHLEVYQLSAQFPGPTTPREFITLLLTSESALTEKSVIKDGIPSDPIPRHFIIISRPLKHPEAPERSGYIRGQYESVELIREVPINRPSTKSTPNLLATKTNDDKQQTLKRSKSDFPAGETEYDAGSAETNDDTELNPVEWIMITRSDPGGGIPRFMVDRGTPSTMISDVHKFLDWAAGSSEAPSAANTADTDEVTSTAEQGSTPAEPVAAQAKAPNGIFQQLTQTLEAGLDAYAPAMISSFVHDKLDGPEQTGLDDTDSDVSSVVSFESATERRHVSTVPAAQSTDSISLASTKDLEDKKHLNSHEKKMLELSKDREKLDRKLAKRRDDEEGRLKKAQNNEESETSKAQERYDKEIKKQEDKHRKEIEKLERKREREEQKLLEKKQKALDRDALHKVTRERDEFRSQVDLLKKENAILRERIEHFEGAEKS